LDFISHNSSVSAGASVSTTIVRFFLIFWLCSVLWPGSTVHAETDGEAVALQAYDRGEELARLGKMGEAAHAFEEAVCRAPENPGIRARLAWLLLDQGQPEKALPHFQHLVARRPHDRDSLTGLAIAHLRLADLFQAKKVLNESLLSFPDDPVLLKLKGEALLSRKETAAQAVSVFERLQKLEPHNAAWAELRGKAASLAAAHKYDEVRAHLKEGDNKAALEALRESVRFDPEHLGYHTHYGWLLLEDGQFRGAARAFEEVVQKDPGKRDAYAGLAVARSGLGDPEGGVEAARKGLKYFKDDPQLLEILGDAASSRSKTLAQAEEAYRRLLMLQPRNHEVSIKLARVLIARGQIDEAERVFAEILTVDPHNVPAHRELGKMNLGGDAYGQAAAHFEEVLAVAPADLEARKGLDQALDRMRSQVQVQSGYFEDSPSFQRSHVYTGIRHYITRNVRIETGYGYVEYDMDNDPAVGRLRERAIRRHVVPLLFNYRPSRRLAFELGTAFSTYSPGDKSGAGKAGIYYQFSPKTGFSLSYSYHDVIDFYGPFKGPWGQHVDDFADRRRYRYLITDPIALWTQNIFRASSTQAVTDDIQAHEAAFWGYHDFSSPFTLSLYGAVSSYTDDNLKTSAGTTITYRVLKDPLLRLKYSFYYLDFRDRSAELAGLPEWAAALYWDPVAYKNHSIGFVFEKNFADRAKLALETDLVFDPEADRPGFLTFVELNFFLSDNISLRALGFYLNSEDKNDTSYKIRNITVGITYRF